MEMNVRSLGIAELCSFDFNGSIAFEGCLPYFRTNMLPFPVTICPNEQSSSIFGLARNVGCDGFLVLELSEPCLVGVSTVNIPCQLQSRQEHRTAVQGHTRSIFGIPEQIRGR